MPRGAYDEALYHIIEGGRRTFLNALQTWRKEMDHEAKMPRCVNEHMRKPGARRSEGAERAVGRTRPAVRMRKGM